MSFAALPWRARLSARQLAWLAFIAVALLAVGIGLRDPWPADEPRFVLVAKNMVESGDWLFPRRGNELYPDKPPIYMWLLAASYVVVGNWRIAFLLPSLIAALGTLVVVYDFARRIGTRRAAALAVLLLLFTVQFTFQSKRAQIDPTVTLMIALSVYALARHLFFGPAWRWFWFGCFMAGLGTVTKGVGFIALLVLLPYAWARFRGYARLAPIGAGGWRWWLGVPAFLTGVGIWLIPMLIAVARADDPQLYDYAREILLFQTAVRYARPAHHLEPPWYFAGVIVEMWWPLAFALPWAIMAWVRRVSVRRDGRVLVLLGFVVLVLVFFSISPGKREVYIMPALPILAVALAPLLPGIVRRAGFQRLAFATAALLTGLGLGAGLAALVGNPNFETRLIEARGWAADDPRPWVLLTAIGGVGAIALAVFRVRRGLLALLTLLAGLWTLYALVGYPLINPSSSGRELMQRVGAVIGPDAELALIGWTEQNLLQADRPATVFGFRTDWAAQRIAAQAWLAEKPANRWVMAQDDALGRCVRREAVREVGRANRRTWFVFNHAALITGCIDDTPGTTGAPRLMPDDD